MEEQPVIRKEVMDQARINGKLESLQKRNNYPGLERLVKLAKQQHPEISRPEIKKFLEADTSRQLTKVQHAKPASGHVVAMVPNELWQMDTFDLNIGNKIKITDIFCVVLTCSQEKHSRNQCYLKILNQLQKLSPEY